MPAPSFFDQNSAQLVSILPMELEKRYLEKEEGEVHELLGNDHCQRIRSRIHQ